MKDVTRERKPPAAADEPKPGDDHRFTRAWGPSLLLAYGIYFVAVGAFCWAVFAAKAGEAKTITICAALLVIVVGPPVWFVIEYWGLVSPSWRAIDQQRNWLRFEQDLVRNIWLAVGTLALATLVFQKDTIVPKQHTQWEYKFINSPSPDHDPGELNKLEAGWELSVVQQGADGSHTWVFRRPKAEK